MIHWPTPPSSPAASRTPRGLTPTVSHPQKHVAVAADARRHMRPIIPWLVSVPLLMMLGATMLKAQQPQRGTAAATQAAASAAFGDSSANRRVIRSWTSDKRDFAIGDIITIVIDENTVASANKATNNTDSKRRQMDFGADLPSATGNGSKSVNINSSNDGSTKQQGDATRSTRFTTEMSVRVIGIEKDGNLKVKGSKVVDVDKERQEMTLSGFVRPSDVSSRDVVDGTRVADLQLLYAAKGSLGKAKTGILGRILGVFWP